MSIRQPWVELILNGRKTIEVRSWSTRYRGRLWLHAGKQCDRNAINMFGFEKSELVTGALLGRCELFDCVEFSCKTWDSWRDLHLNAGQPNRRLYAWVLQDVKRISPIPFKGRLGLMKMDSLPGVRNEQ
ncbi:MAG: ASCH domain-containing protein [Myxococcota bacterium]|nr:ASCH domain-containing protein [Myxococcota bacterium]